MAFSDAGGLKPLGATDFEILVIYSIGLLAVLCSLEQLNSNSCLINRPRMTP